MMRVNVMGAMNAALWFGSTFAAASVGVRVCVVSKVEKKKEEDDDDDDDDGGRTAEKTKWYPGNETNKEQKNKKTPRTRWCEIMGKSGREREKAVVNGKKGENRLNTAAKPHQPHFSLTPTTPSLSLASQAPRSIYSQCSS